LSIVIVKYQKSTSAHQSLPEWVKSSIMMFADDAKISTGVQKLAVYA